MQSTNIGYHSDNLLLKIYEKNFLLPFCSENSLQLGVKYIYIIFLTGFSAERSIFIYHLATKNTHYNYTTKF